MWDGDTRADAGADLFLASFECGKHRLLLGLRQQVDFHEVIHEFLDGRPVFHGLHIKDDLVCAEQVSQLHKSNRIPQIFAVGASGYRCEGSLASGFTLHG